MEDIYLLPDTNIFYIFLLLHALLVTAHILGGQGELFGHKTKEITSKTNCVINLSTNSSRTKPLVITIKSEDGNRGISLAKRMIEDSIFEFLGDENSEAKLICEMALTSEGNYFIAKSSEGAIRQERRTRDGMVWMQFLELPLAELRGNRQGEFIPHGAFLEQGCVQDELIGHTDCSIEVYGFGNNTPTYCDPYVLVTGKKKDEVHTVAENITKKLLKHQAKCGRCSFLS